MMYDLCDTHFMPIPHHLSIAATFSGCKHQHKSMPSYQTGDDIPRIVIPGIFVYDDVTLRHIISLGKTLMGGLTSDLM
jgi:hypothetical protein